MTERATDLIGLLTDAGRFERYSAAAKRRWADPSYRGSNLATRKAKAEARNAARREAASAGLLRYTTGLPCPNGHVGERYTATGRCVACKAGRDAMKSDEAKERARQRAAEYRRLHPEKAKAAVNVWRSRHLEDVRAKQREHYKKNSEARMRKTRQWMVKNRDRVRSYAYRRRAKKTTNGGEFTVADIAAIRAAQRDRCAYCKIKLGWKYTIDHIVPVSQGGSNGRRNLQLVCRPCNSSKGARDPLAFAQQRGLLL